MSLSSSLGESFTLVGLDDSLPLEDSENSIILNDSYEARSVSSNRSQSTHKSLDSKQNKMKKTNKYIDIKSPFYSSESPLSEPNTVKRNQESFTRRISKLSESPNNNENTLTSSIVEISKYSIDNTSTPDHHSSFKSSSQTFHSPTSNDESPETMSSNTRTELMSTTKTHTNESNHISKNTSINSSDYTRTPQSRTSVASSLPIFEESSLSEISSRKDVEDSIDLDVDRSVELEESIVSKKSRSTRNSAIITPESVPLANDHLRTEDDVGDDTNQSNINVMTDNISDDYMHQSATDLSATGRSIVSASASRKTPGSQRRVSFSADTATKRKSKSSLSSAEKSPIGSVLSTKDTTTSPVSIHKEREI